MERSDARARDTKKAKEQPRLRPPRDTATADLKSVLLGGGLFDVSGEHFNQKGWDIFELGQRSFWAVPDAIPWDEPCNEDPEYAEPIASMLSFLAPGEKAAVTGASYISTMVKSEEAKFYFVEQALEEAKHFDVLRRLVPKITGRPMEAPNRWIRILYSFGVLDRTSVAFMMGNINIIGEHLANQIFHKINRVAKSEHVREVIALIGRDESRHVAAGKRFFPEVYDDFKKNRGEIIAKNLATTIILSLAGHDRVGPMRKLKIDLGEILVAMYQHYEDVTHGLPAFPEQAVLDKILSLLEKGTPIVIRTIGSMTTDDGEFDLRRFVALCERAISSPRALREMLGL
jgi:rubrerythrin